MRSLLLQNISMEEDMLQGEDVAIEARHKLNGPRGNVEKGRRRLQSGDSRRTAKGVDRHCNPGSHGGLQKGSTG